MGWGEGGSRRLSKELPIPPLSLRFIEKHELLREGHRSWRLSCPGLVLVPLQCPTVLRGHAGNKASVLRAVEKTDPLGGSHSLDRCSRHTLLPLSEVPPSLPTPTHGVRPEQRELCDNHKLIIPGKKLSRKTHSKIGPKLPWATSSNKHCPQQWWLAAPLALGLNSAGSYSLNQDKQPQNSVS